jgi:hypothetical protein
MESSQKRELVISTELKKDGMITISVADTLGNRRAQTRRRWPCSPSI